MTPFSVFLLSISLCAVSATTMQAQKPKIDVTNQGDPAQTPTVSSGKIVRYANFPSKFVDARNVDIWLPKGYSKKKKYAVVYMHDGQMLYDSTKTWNKQEWAVDETAAKLQKDGRTKPFIIVGIWNNNEFRRGEYFPQAVLAKIPEPARSEGIKNFLQDKPQADNYLKFLVEELKPYVDKTFSTAPGPENTTIAGSSMGGLISLYGICEYPQVFGAAACLSLHSPMISVEGITDELDEKAPKYFRQYLAEKLPQANTRKIYIDRGDQTLDSFYKPFHDKIDAVFAEKGWSSPTFVSRVFPGTDHSEKAWAARMDIVFMFLAGK